MSDEGNHARKSGREEGVQHSFAVNALDEHDPDAVYEWALGSCERAPLAALADDVGADPTVESILHRLPLTFPEQTRDAALRGCRAGFERRGMISQR